MRGSSPSEGKLRARDRGPQKQCARQFFVRAQKVNLFSLSHEFARRQDGKALVRVRARPR
jgi:hypothetical protein